MCRKKIEIKTDPTKNNQPRRKRAATITRMTKLKTAIMNHLLVMEAKIIEAPIRLRAVEFPNPINNCKRRLRKVTTGMTIKAVEAEDADVVEEEGKVEEAVEEEAITAMQTRTVTALRTISQVVVMFDTSKIS
jgi:hypothetical protein